MKTKYNNLEVSESDKISFDEFCFFKITEDETVIRDWGELLLLIILCENNTLEKYEDDFELVLKCTFSVNEDETGKSIIKSGMDEIPKEYFKLIEEYSKFINIINNDTIILNKLEDILKKNIIK